MHTHLHTRTYTHKKSFSVHHAHLVRVLTERTHAESVARERIEADAAQREYALATKLEKQRVEAEMMHAVTTNHTPHSRTLPTDSA